MLAKLISNALCDSNLMSFPGSEHDFPWRCSNQIHKWPLRPLEGEVRVRDGEGFIVPSTLTLMTAKLQANRYNLYLWVPVWWTAQSILQPALLQALPACGRSPIGWSEPVHGQVCRCNLLDVEGNPWMGNSEEKKQTKKKNVPHRACSPRQGLIPAPNRIM